MKERAESEGTYTTTPVPMVPSKCPPVKLIQLQHHRQFSSLSNAAKTKKQRT